MSEARSPENAIFIYVQHLNIAGNVLIKFNGNRYVMSAIEPVVPTIRQKRRMARSRSTRRLRRSKHGRYGMSVIAQYRAAEPMNAGYTFFFTGECFGDQSRPFEDKRCPAEKQRRDNKGRESDAGNPIHTGRFSSSAPLR